MHYLFKAIMIHIGLVLGLGNMQWSQSKFISNHKKCKAFDFSLLNILSFVFEKNLFESLNHLNS